MEVLLQNMPPENTGKKIASIRCLNPKVDDDRQQPNNPYVVCVHHGTDLDGWTSAALCNAGLKRMV